MHYSENCSREGKYRRPESVKLIKKLNSVFEFTYFTKREDEDV